MLNVNEIIQAGGLLLITLIIFAECGLLLGFILPGDSLLIAAGVFAAKGKLPIDGLIVLVVLASIVGYEVGYIIGRRIGPKLFKRDDGFLFRREYIQKTEEFFKKYGVLTLVMARFVPHVRTLVSSVAGAASMNRRQYFIFNVIGAILWGAGLVLLGYWLGSNVANIEQYIIPLLLFALLILYSVTFWRVMKSPQRRHNIKRGLREDWNYYFGKKT